jgi:nitrogen-specific signal transduction histidine kinase
VPRTDLPAVRAAGMALHAAHVEREKLLQVERQGRRVAEEANRAKDEFLAMLGHELRNPLNAITTAAALLQRSQSADTAQQAKDIIARQSLHLGRLTDDLLDAGRVMLGKIVLARAPVDLAALVDHEMKTLARTGRLLGYGVDARLEPAWVWGDRTRLEQVIGNLLGNALKYTPRGGTIGVAVGRERDDAVLRVRDTGIGLEPDLLPRVFDLFVQGARSADRAQGGLGIGLTLVRRLAELHGGAVEGHSDGANRGAEFVVRLPAISAPPAEPANAPAGARLARRVVVVEDNDDARATLAELLRLQGHEVREAADGPAGVTAILECAPDVALVDIGLPGLDGRALAREVRRRATWPLRLVALSGYGARDDEADDFDDYLVKPLDPAKLDEVLAAAPTGAA